MNAMKTNALEKVQALIDDDPSILGGLFKMVSDNWDKMVTQQNQSRESSHLYALSQMLDNLWLMFLRRKKNQRLFTNDECCTLLDACEAVMGSFNGLSESQRSVLRHLAKSCRALGWQPTDSFITGIREKGEFLDKLYLKFVKS